MITRTKQDWNVGNTVRVGFLKLVVKAAVATPGDFAPDAYILSNVAGTQLYKFVPHNGVEKIDLIEARELLAKAQLHAKRAAERALKRADESSRAIAAINEIIFQ